MPTERERQRWDRQAATLREIETDEVPASTERTIAWANELRRRSGVPPLEHRDRPEMELHRRARALGLCRRRG